MTRPHKAQFAETRRAKLSISANNEVKPREDARTSVLSSLLSWEENRHGGVVPIRRKAKTKDVSQYDGR